MGYSFVLKRCELVRVNERACVRACSRLSGERKRQSGSVCGVCHTQSVCVCVCVCVQL